METQGLMEHHQAEMLVIEITEGEKRENGKDNIFFKKQPKISQIIYIYIYSKPQLTEL